MDPATDPVPSRSLAPGVAAAALAAAAFAAFVPALRCDFVNVDDTLYVTRTPQVLDGLTRDGLAWAFTTYHSANWHPLTWLSLQLDATLWKTADGRPDPRGFHLTNVLLHAANAALLFLALRALTGAYWRSLAVALLFAVHPLRVESVAWVSERKDVLSAFFGLLALCSYAGYAHRPGVWRYLLVSVLFALSLLAKPMLVTLPCLLLVLDWWPLARARALGDWGRLAAEKLPLLVLVAASSAVTVQAQASEGAVADLARFPLDARLANAAVSYVAYLFKTVWPSGLAFYYPHPAYRIGSSGMTLRAQAGGAVLLLVTLTAGAVALRRRAPYLLAGWLWYLGTLVPVIGIVQVGGQAYADRYSYLPQVGILVAACWGVADLAGARARPFLALAGAAAVALAVVTWNQIGVWRDAVTLWEHDLAVTEANPIALINLGASLEQREQWDRAERCFRQALALNGDAFEAHMDLGFILRKQRRLPEAAYHYKEWCRLKPGSVQAHDSLAGVLLQVGRPDEAAEQYREILRLEPDNSAARCNLGNVEAGRGRWVQAEEHYRVALALRPDWAEARSYLGNVLINQGKVKEGTAELSKAVEGDPRSAPALINLGKALEDQGDAAGAAARYEEAAAVLAGSAADPRAAQLRAALEAAAGRLDAAGRGDPARRIRERLPRVEPVRSAAGTGSPAAAR